MKLRYFFVDDRGQLQKASQAGVRGVWEGHRRAEALGCKSANDLRLVSIVCDHDLIPSRIYILRVHLTDGFVTGENRLAMHLLTLPDCVSPNEMVNHHSEGWPTDLLRQLAIALDVPLGALQVPFGIGGPLFTKAELRVAIKQPIRALS
jgi:hypothetical protein